MSSPSATSEPFETRSKPIDKKQEFSFPKQYRLLRSSDYRRVYRDGMRVSGPYFRVFCAASEEAPGPRVGLTVPRALGKAVVRNRIKRRMREAVRYEIGNLDPRWNVVFNPRKPVVDAPMLELRREVQRVFRKCSGS